MSLIGKKFYWDTKSDDQYVFPKDIRILKEYDEFVLTTNKEKISKDILFKYYTMITPEIVFCIRILTNIDLRKSLIITVNSFKDENENGVIYYEYLDILKLYLEYYLDNNLSAHYMAKRTVIQLLDDEHVMKIQIPNSSKFYNERRFVVYGYKEDTFKNFFHYIPRKRWLSIIKNTIETVDAIYDYKIKFSGKLFYRFFKFLFKNYSKSIEVCHILNIIPERYFDIDNYSIINILISLKLSKKQNLFELDRIEKNTVSLLDSYNYGKYNNYQINSQLQMDLTSLKMTKYSNKTSLNMLRINNPKDKIVLIKLNNNDIYIVLYQYKPILNQVLSNESALSKNELKTFLTRK